MSIEMNNLKNILFANIQCTTDVVKTLKKKERPQYWYHDVLYQQKFDHLIYYK